MKIALPLLVLMYLAFPPSAPCAFFQWVDGQGVTHFTDNPDTIPERYRKRAQKLELSGEPAASRPAAAEPHPQPPPPTAQPEAPSGDYGGHPEAWWRDSFSLLRGELDTLQKDLADRQTKLVALRRKRALYMRAQDREAVNAMQDAINADEVRLAQLQNQLAELEQRAAKAAVPVQWRR